MALATIDPDTLPSCEAIDAELARRSLRTYLEWIWPIVEPSTPFIPGWHLDAICDHLEAVTRKAIRHLLITVPPRHTKSLICSVAWPTWTWATDPALRFLFASYAADLSTEHAVLSRRVIESGKYQSAFGHRVMLTTDQNIKTFYENTARGYRMSTSVGGSATGRGGDFCLDGSTPIMTDDGPIPVRTIVEQRLRVKVLGHSGRWQDIEAYEIFPGRPMIELQTEDGHILRCTDDHPVFFPEFRCYAATEKIYSEHGNVQVQCLRQSGRAASSSRGQNEGDFLLSPLFLSLTNRREESAVDRRPGDADLCVVSQNVQRESRRSKAAKPEVLFIQVPGYLAAGAASHGMSDLSRIIHSTTTDTENVQSRLRRNHSPARDSWQAERTIPHRQMDDEIWSRLHGETSTHNHPPGWNGLCEVPEAIDLASPSHQRLEDLPRAAKPCDALYLLPSHCSHEDRHRQSLDEAVRLSSVRRIGTPDHVYNLRVAPDHTYYAAGILTHNCVIDDPHNLKEIHSDPIRSEVLRWHDQVWSTRLNDPEHGARVVIMQRGHEQDLGAHLLARGGYVHLNLPSEYEPTTWVSPIGWRDPRRTPGELLCPARVGRVAIAEAKRDLGSYGFASQHQQRPAPAEGGLIKRQWWKWYGERPTQCEELIASWDMAFKKTSDTDYVVGQVWGRVGADCYLVDQVRDRMTFSSTLQAVRSLSAKWPQACTKLVEDAANGPAVIDTLTREIPGLIAVKPEGGKVARLNAVSPLIEAGNVWLPHPDLAPWIHDFIEEVSVFPNGANDDQVDAMSQALMRMRSGGEFGISLGAATPSQQPERYAHLPEVHNGVEVSAHAAAGCVRCHSRLAEVR